MNLKPITEFKELNYGLDSNGQIIKVAPIIVNPHNYFTNYNNLKKYDAEIADLIVSIKQLDKYFIPIEEFVFIEWSKSKKQFMAYYQAYKSKTEDYYIIVDTEKWESVEEGPVEIGDEMFIVSTIYYDGTKPDTCLKIVKDLNIISKACTPKHEPQISIVLKTSKGYEVKKRKIKPYIVDIHKNYNDDFKEVYDLIVDRLTNGDKGVVLLHSIPGVGKTSLIRHLTEVVPNKAFIFITSNLIPHLTDPSFISVLMDHKDSILVLEDSEAYLKDRNVSGENGVVSTILNLSDGILSDILGIQIICTFNADLGKIDEALMRDGRLIAQYEFGKLTLDKCRLHDESIEEEMTLAEVYNLKTKAHRTQTKKKQIGFNR